MISTCKWQLQANIHPAASRYSHVATSLKAGFIKDNKSNETTQLSWYQTDQSNHPIHCFSYLINPLNPLSLINNTVSMKDLGGK